MGARLPKAARIHHPDSPPVPRGLLPPFPTPPQGWHGKSEGFPGREGAEAEGEGQIEACTEEMLECLGPGCER